MTYYAGLDVSLRTVNICVINDQGEFIAETKVDSEVTDLVAYLDGLDLDILSVGLEAGTMTQFLTYGLQSAGFEVAFGRTGQWESVLPTGTVKASETRLSTLSPVREFKKARI